MIVDDAKIMRVVYDGRNSFNMGYTIIGCPCTYHCGITTNMKCRYNVLQSLIPIDSFVLVLKKFFVNNQLRYLVLSQHNKIGWLFGSELSTCLVDNSDVTDRVSQ